MTASSSSVLADLTQPTSSSKPENTNVKQVAATMDSKPQPEPSMPESPTVDNSQINPPKNDTPEYDVKYDIEIILFRHKNAQTNGELWETVDDTYLNELLDHLFADQVQTLGYYHWQQKTFIPKQNFAHALTAEQQKLLDIAEHIRQSKHYQLLAHFAWRQPGLPADKAMAVTFPYHATAESLPLFGKITVSLSRYLHTYLEFHQIEAVCRNQKDSINIQVQTLSATQKTKRQNLALDTAKNPLPSSNLSPLSMELSSTNHCRDEDIVFKQHRKMRSRELHYLDHPVFGMLIQITPYKPATSS